MSLLELQNVNVNYNGKPALESVSVSIAEAELVSVIGPNGSGKSTLFKAILNLVDYSGEIKFKGKSTKNHFNKIGYMPQRNDVDVNFPITVREVVEQSQLGKKFSSRKVNKAIKDVQLEGLEDSNISQLSGGQLQRVFLARALAQDSDLIILDEPFSNTDLVAEESLIVLIKELVKEGKTVLISTHDLKQAQEISTKLILLNKTIICYGNPKEVCSKQHLLETFRQNILISSDTGEITLSDHHHH